MTVLIDSYSETNQNGTQSVYGNERWGQSFANTNARPIKNIGVYLTKTGTLTGTAYVEVWSHYGTYGTGGTPDTLLATSDLMDVTTISASPAWFDFTFSGVNKITLGDLTKYCFVVYYPTGTGSNYINIYRDSSSPTHGGNSIYRSAGAFVAFNSIDLCFHVNGDDLKTLTFAGVNYLPYYKSNTVKIREKIRKTNVMNLDIVTKGISSAPQEGSEVIYKDGSRFLFGGYITRVQTNETGKGELFTFNVEVSDYSIIFNDKIARRAYTNQTLAYIVADLFATYMDTGYGFDLTNVATGPVIESVSFDHISLAKCFEKLCLITGYVWNVDYEKKMYFQLPSTTVSPAPETVTDSSNNVEKIEISYDATQVRNSIIVIGAVDGVDSLDLITQTFTGDGSTTSWTIDEYPSSVLSIKINGTAQQFSEDINERDTDEMVYTYSSKSFRKGPVGITPSFGDTIEIKYYPKLPVIEQITDPVSIAFFKALDGGDGIKEYTIKDPAISSIAEAQSRGQQELNEYSMPLVDGQITTRTGLLGANHIFKPGQMLTVNLPSQGLVTDTAFLIQEVSITLNEDGVDTEYTYQLTFGGKVIGVGEFLEYIAAQSSVGTEGATSDQILTIEHINDQMEFSDSDVAISSLIQTPPFKYTGGSPVGKYNLSEYK